MFDSIMTEIYWNSLGYWEQWKQATKKVAEQLITELDTQEVQELADSADRWSKNVVDYKALIVASNATKTLTSWEFQFTNAIDYPWTDSTDRSDTYISLNKAYRLMKYWDASHAQAFGSLADSLWVDAEMTPQWFVWVLSKKLVALGYNTRLVGWEEQPFTPSSDNDFIYMLLRFQLSNWLQPDMIAWASTINAMLDAQPVHRLEPIQHVGEESLLEHVSAVSSVVDQQELPQDADTDWLDLYSEDTRAVDWRTEPTRISRITLANQEAESRGISISAEKMSDGSYILRKEFSDDIITVSAEQYASWEPIFFTEYYELVDWKDTWKALRVVPDQSQTDGFVIEIEKSDRSSAPEWYS